jgi:nicotinamide-nucleotide amidase
MAIATEVCNEHAYNATMKELVRHAAHVGALLKARNETVAVCESSAGGLITAALLAVPGASAWVLGGMVIYTRQAWDALAGFEESQLRGARSSTETNAQVRADLIRERFGASWGLGETGAAGPTGNRYGDPAGHACLAVSGPRQGATTLRTGETDRLGNMHAFTIAALNFFAEKLKAEP